MIPDSKITPKLETIISHKKTNREIPQQINHLTVEDNRANQLHAQQVQPYYYSQPNEEPIKVASAYNYHNGIDHQENHQNKVSAGSNNVIVVPPGKQVIIVNQQSHPNKQPEPSSWTRDTRIGCCCLSVNHTNPLCTYYCINCFCNCIQNANLCCYCHNMDCVYCCTNNICQICGDHGFCQCLITCCRNQPLCLLFQCLKNAGCCECLCGLFRNNCQCICGLCRNCNLFECICGALQNCDCGALKDCSGILCGAVCDLICCFFR